jgi:hypothetical protein
VNEKIEEITAFTLYLTTIEKYARRRRRENGAGRKKGRDQRRGHL